MEQIIFILKSFILGVVEGLTEFLPVSSTGHMIIVENLLNFQGETAYYVEMYTYVIQLGAILAIVYLYFDKFKDTLLNFFPTKKLGIEKSGFWFWFTIGFACIPGFFAQILLGDIADKYLFNPTSVAIVLIGGGFFMIYMENKYRGKNYSQKNLSLSLKQAFIVGLFQCLAILPGMSRSASTIIGGWVCGLSSVAAAEFSFFLAVPVMIGMSFLKLVKIGGLSGITSIELVSLFVGFIISFFVAIIVVNKFVNYLKKKPMRVFAYYRFIFGIVVLISGFFGMFTMKG